MSYPGGKNGAGVFQKIINLMPPHERYFEPFLGGGAILRLKLPAKRNIACDLVGSQISAMKVCIAGKVEAAGIIVDADGRRRRRSPVSAMRDRGSGLAGKREWGPEISYRLFRGCGIRLLETAIFSPTDMVYCDPPYLMETRRGRRIYEFEMSTIEHRQLLRAIRKIKGMVMISGYWSSLYAEMLEGWNSIHFEAMTRGGRTATEWLWFNFEPPVELHDYGYLGEGFRERERIKRKKQRWTSRLQRMDRLERQALLSAIASTKFSSDASRP